MAYTTPSLLKLGGKLGLAEIDRAPRAAVAI
jgi:hypothetical protein